jgi:Inhibitor of vertebrate lysozyme (Ivy)
MPRLKHLSLGCALAVWAGSRTGVALAQAPSDLALGDQTAALARNHPVAYRAYLSELPGGLGSLPWLRHLDRDTSGPVETILVDDHAMLAGFACIPHDCGPNSLYLLFSPDQSRVVGLLHLENSFGKDSVVVFGEPTPAELVCLRRGPSSGGNPLTC